MSDISFFDAEQNPSEGLEYRRAQPGWFDLAQFGLTAGAKYHDADATGSSHCAVRAGPYLRRKQQGASDRNRLPLVVAVIGSALFAEPRYLDRARTLVLTNRQKRILPQRRTTIAARTYVPPLFVKGIISRH